MVKEGLTRLSVSSAEYYAYHGVKSEEKKLGGKYEVDLDLYYNAKRAILSDNVKDSINYEEALFCVSEVINGNENYDLVETMCSDILDTLMDKFPELLIATVRIRKYAVPMRRIIGFIEAEQTFSRLDE